MRTWNFSGRSHLTPYCKRQNFSRCQHPLQLHAGIPTNEELLQALDKLEDGDISSNASSEESLASQNAAQDVASRVVSQLPQSPLTDPKLNAARFGHKKPKLLPKKQELSPFQLRLNKNPYAHALATPPRYCLLTGARTPKYFQIPFGLTSHPETGEKWHLPTLAGDPALAEEDDSGFNEKKAPEVQGRKIADSKEHLHETSDRKLDPRTLSGVNILNSRRALTFISHLHATRYRRLLPFRWKQDIVIKNKAVIWREDMADFTLELMRRKAVREILRLTSRTSAMYVVPCNSWDDVGFKAQIGAVLWLRKPREVDGTETENSEEDVKQQQDGPPLYAMARYHGNHIPIYNLRTLLGEQHLFRLRDERPGILDSDIAAVKAKNLTVDLQLGLWKLLGYLAQ